MARLSFAAHPFLLGFEQIDRLLEKSIKSSNDGFPPYNITKETKREYRDTKLMFGFAKKLQKNLKTI